MEMKEIISIERERKREREREREILRTNRQIEDRYRKIKIKNENIY